MKSELINFKNAKVHDIWKTIGFSIASLGLVTVSWLSPSYSPLTAVTAIGTGMATFGCAFAVKYDIESI